MNISLTSEQEALVARLIKCGRYESKSDAVREAFKLLEENEAVLADLRQKVQEGLAAADRGELIDAEDVFEQLKSDHEEQFGKQDWRV